ncbi:hypothetical protein ACOME3_009850 [Neoechinorhynchus agilis]
MGCIFFGALLLLSDLMIPVKLDKIKVEKLIAYTADTGLPPSIDLSGGGKFNKQDFKDRFRSNIENNWRTTLLHAEEHSQVNTFQKIYKENDIFYVKERDLIGLIKEMADDMNQAIMKKLKAVENLVRTTEKSYVQFMGKPESNQQNYHRHYYNAKLLQICNNSTNQTTSAPTTEEQVVKSSNGQCLILEADKHFMDLAVNLSYSTVHVPTIIYDQSKEIMDSAAWSFDLNRAFSENYMNDPEITWQYFCSATGLYRTWPGTRWTYPENMPPNNQVDLFDCRVRTWYVKATSSPRDVIILIDNSGSMTGIKRSIAVQTVETILDTLSDDDFVNILSFNNEVKYVDKCFDHGLIQATVENRKHLQEAIAQLQTKDIAHFIKAFEMAFKILNQARLGISRTENVTCICQSHYTNSSPSSDEQNCRASPSASEQREMFLDSSGCNKMIMVVTDGSSETAEQAFRKYNWFQDYNTTCHPKETRVFTYLIGREISDERAVKWMACSNKGFYAHVSTLEDIQDNVQDYIPVISRPIALSNDHVTVWSSVFLDIEKNDPLKEYKWYPYKLTDRTMPMDAFKAKTKKYHLMISVAQPAFQRKSNKKKDKLGGLLGAVAVDIPVRLLHEFAPAHRLGVNGYSFLINHNGYVIYHPDLRPVLGEYRKRNYNSIDIDALEIPLDLENYTYPLPESPIQQLRREMIKGYTGNLSAIVKRAYDDMRRVEVTKISYYFSTLGDKDSNPFSLGIAIREPYGRYEPRPKQIDKAMVQKAIAFANESFVQFSDWVHCNSTIENRPEYAMNPVLHYLNEKLQKKNLPSCSTNSKRYIIDRVIGDLYLMSKFNESFNKKKHESHDVGSKVIFASSSSGISSYWCPGGCNDAKRSIIDQYLSNSAVNIESVIYGRTVNFTLEERTRNTLMENNVDATFLFSLFFVETESDGIAKYFPHIVATTAVWLPSDDGKIDFPVAVVGVIMAYDYALQLDFLMKLYDYCTNENNGKKHCFITDENGYIMAHNSVPELMDNRQHIGKFFGEVNGIVMHDLVKRGIFEKVRVFDFQSVCVSIGIKPKSATSNSQLVTAFSPLMVIHSIWVYLLGVLVLLSRAMKSIAQQSLTDILPTHIDFQEPAKYYTPHKTIARQLEACIEEFYLFQTRYRIDGILAFEAQCTNPIHECSVSYTIQGLPRTNMYLIHYDDCCSECQAEMALKIVKKPIKLNETEKCIRLKSTPYRERPQKCYFVNDEEISAACSGAYLVKLSIVVIAIQLMLLMSAQ